MQAEQNSNIVRTIYNKDNIRDVSVDELLIAAANYPYSSLLQLFYSKTLKERNDARYPASVAKTALYFSNPHWLHHQLQDKVDVFSTLIDAPAKYTQEEVVPEIQEENELVINSDGTHISGSHSVETEEEEKEPEISALADTLNIEEYSSENTTAKQEEPVTSEEFGPEVIESVITSGRAEEQSGTETEEALLFNDEIPEEIPEGQEKTDIISIEDTFEAVIQESGSNVMVNEEEAELSFREPDTEQVEIPSQSLPESVNEPTGSELSEEDTFEPVIPESGSNEMVNEEEAGLSFREPDTEQAEIPLQSVSESVDEPIGSELSEEDTFEPVILESGSNEVVSEEGAEIPFREPETYKEEISSPTITESIHEPVGPEHAEEVVSEEKINIYPEFEEHELLQPDPFQDNLLTDAEYTEKEPVQITEEPETAESDKNNQENTDSIVDLEKLTASEMESGTPSIEQVTEKEDTVVEDNEIPEMQKVELSATISEVPEQIIPFTDKEKLSEQPDPSLLSFEPLHTVDYFASQGIKINLDDENKDQLSNKLRSFTEWLRSMKKIHPEKLKNELDEKTEMVIKTVAEHSNDQGEILTETMAEILQKQGLIDKALEVYEKLSLLNPSKSDYFAAKISALKAIGI